MSKHWLRRLIAMILPVFVVISQMPIWVVSAERGGEIVSFEKLEEKVAVQEKTTFYMP